MLLVSVHHMYAFKEAKKGSGWVLETKLQASVVLLINY